MQREMNAFGASAQHVAARLASAEAGLAADAAGLVDAEVLAREGAGPTLRERLAKYRSRILRMSLGLLVLLPGIWGFLHYFVLLRTNDATLSTRMVTLRTPIAGYLRLGSVITGDLLRNGQVVALVENTRVDTSRQAELSSHVQALEAQIEASQATISRLEGFLVTLRSRGNRYAVLRMNQLQAQLAESSQQADASRAGAVDAQKRLQRARALLTEGLSTEEEVSAREREQLVTSAGVEAALRHSDALRVELESMRSGYTLDNFSDKPYSLQRVDEIDLALVRARVGLGEQSKSLQTSRVELGEETKRVDLQRRASIESPLAGRLWTVTAANGEFVNAGQPVVEVIDCSKLIVVGQVSQRKYARIHIGMRARFEPLGCNEIYNGVVAQKLGVTNPGDPLSSRTYGVAVEFPLLAAELAPLCEIGLSGEVRFGD